MGCSLSSELCGPEIQNGIDSKHPLNIVTQPFPSLEPQMDQIIKDQQRAINRELDIQQISEQQIREVEQRFNEETIEEKKSIKLRSEIEQRNTIISDQATVIQNQKSQIQIQTISNQVREIEQMYNDRLKRTIEKKDSIISILKSELEQGNAIISKTRDRYTGATIAN
ncbi:hypothetical protein HK098_003093 [Nowakowskiella sp. JEL0407]|nr:hypothetical protein HK098_003093 [Nowakowskiella sp. JEL0407]